MENMSPTPIPSPETTKHRHPSYKELHIFRRETGGWYAGYHHNGTYRRKSTRTKSLTLALTIGGEWYLREKAAITLGIPTTRPKNTVRDASVLALKRLETAVERGDRSKSYLTSVRLLLNSDILPFFGDIDVAEVGSKKWSEYEVSLLDRKLTRQTLHQHRNALRRCLNEAIRQEWIDKLPSLKLDNIGKAQQKPRVWFEPKEFGRLLEAARQHIQDLRNTRWANDALECYDLIIWIANTGMRVGEVRNVKVNDVELHAETASDGAARPYCLIKNIKGKRGTGDCRSWYDAYSAYQRIILRRSIASPASCSEPLFLCHHRDMFNAILTKADLKYAPGEPARRRDLVSLRHTYIAFRILQGVGVYDIARNCRTSVTMIENHYARYLCARLLTGLNRFTPPAVPKKAKERARQKHTPRPTAGANHNRSFSDQPPPTVHLGTMKGSENDV